MSELRRHWKINGVLRELKVTGTARLLDVLRSTGSQGLRPSGVEPNAALTSVKEGCGEGECGTCTVVIDGQAQLACMVMAGQLEDGTELLTAEGLADDPIGARLIAAFSTTGAVQCGYCSPGMLLAAWALLHENAAPSTEQVREALAGNICRCTGYRSIIEAVELAAGAER